MEEEFDVNCHPTFLIINSDGQLLAKSTGAGETEDKFIAELSFCINEENFIANKRKGYESGSVSAIDYYNYCEKMGLRGEMSKALNALFLEAKKAGQLDSFVKKYCDFTPMVYFDLVDSELYDFMLENEAMILKSGVKKDYYPLFLSSPLESAIERMLCSGDYSEKELNKIAGLIGTDRNAKVLKIQIEAVKRRKVDGWEGAIEVYRKAIETLNEDEIFSLNLALIRNYKYTMRTAPYMQEYLKKCIERSPKRGKRSYS